jgi:4-hydroxybenzoate polyprenyltransferase
MLAFLRLTRPLNLLIIVFTMAAMRYGVVGSYLAYESAAMQLMSSDPTVGLLTETPNNTLAHAFPELLFWLLVFSTVLIAAGGNVINDYFDTRIDRVNKPDDLIVGRTVKRRVAMAGHFALSGAGLLLALLVAWRSGQWKWVIIPVFAIGTLWFYSTSMKRSFLIGNGAVALLSAMVPLTVGLYEITALARTYPTQVMLGTTDGQALPVAFDFNIPWFWVLGYAAFAFVTTLVREIQKDLADVKGDQADGCRTLPIVLGRKWAKAIAIGYLVLALIGVLVLRMTVLHDRLSYWYIGFIVIGPLLLSMGFTYNAITRREFNTAGNLMKVAMVVAIAYAFLLPHTLWNPALL